MTFHYSQENFPKFSALFSINHARYKERKVFLLFEIRAFTVVYLFITIWKTVIMPGQVLLASTWICQISNRNKCVGLTFMIIWEMFHGTISLNSVLLLLLLKFVSGMRLELMYISCIINIRSALTHLHGFQLPVLLP